MRRANEPPIVGTSSKGEAFRQAIENQSAAVPVPLYPSGAIYRRKVVLEERWRSAEEGVDEPRVSVYQG
jgi:hypothetical protein